VEAIVTGNKRHFLRKEYKGVKILSPAEFLETMEGKM
jgi:predicted nucleic acid-binding protein